MSKKKKHSNSPHSSCNHHQLWKDQYFYCVESSLCCPLSGCGQSSLSATCYTLSLLATVFPLPSPPIPPSIQKGLSCRWLLSLSLLPSTYLLCVNEDDTVLHRKLQDLWNRVVKEPSGVEGGMKRGLTTNCKNNSRDASRINKKPKIWTTNCRWLAWNTYQRLNILKEDKKKMTLKSKHTLN